MSTIDRKGFNQASISSNLLGPWTTEEQRLRDRFNGEFWCSTAFWSLVSSCRSCWTLQCCEGLIDGLPLHLKRTTIYCETNQRVRRRIHSWTANSMKSSSTLLVTSMTLARGVSTTHCETEQDRDAIRCPRPRPSRFDIRFCKVSQPVIGHVTTTSQRLSLSPTSNARYVLGRCHDDRQKLPVETIHVGFSSQRTFPSSTTRRWSTPSLEVDPNGSENNHKSLMRGQHPSRASHRLKRCSSRSDYSKCPAEETDCVRTAGWFSIR